MCIFAFSRKINTSFRVNSKHSPKFEIIVNWVPYFLIWSIEYSNQLSVYIELLDFIKLMGTLRGLALILKNKQNRSNL